MLPPLPVLRQAIRNSLAAARAEGHDVEGLPEAVAAAPDSYDALLALAHRVADAPLRPDWPHVEPHDLEDIWAECDPARATEPVAAIPAAEAAARVQAAFLGSVCGCMLGKPVEVAPTLAELREALERLGEWPLRDYLSERLNLRGCHAQHASAAETWRERLRYVAPDDDIHYTVLGMLALERAGRDFTRDDLRELWQMHQAIHHTFGPERAVMARIGLHYWGLDHGGLPATDYREWTHVLNPAGELCGALIRADAYGYACPGHPALAAELAWRDATMTHRRTGVYGAMFVAAAIAAAFVERDRLRVFETALRYVPRRSRFHHIVADSLEMVRTASDWLEGYARIHGRYREHGHCRVHQECGTLINTLRFAEDVGDGICKQVSQGNDTDSFGATAGSILGAYFGPGHLASRWLAPLHDEVRIGLAAFHERSLSALARRMGELPRRVGAADLRA